jgi:murein DD-endopeptidase MepM/ murein hydrolase activator NlpD
MGFGNPVNGPILENKAPWPGTPTFRVTQTFAQHVATRAAAIAAGTPPDQAPGLGIDLGNGRCNDPVMAMVAGTVTLAGFLGAAKVVRYRPSATEEFGAAHLATIMVTVGQKVTKGQQIGTLGMTGATACHLHQGYTINGVEQDWWPILESNMLPDTGTGDDVNLKGTNPRPIVNRTTKLAQGGYLVLAGHRQPDPRHVRVVRRLGVPVGGQGDLRLPVARPVHQPTRPQAD